MLIWIFGQPGTGKTTIAKEIYAHMLMSAIYQPHYLDENDFVDLYKNMAFKISEEAGIITSQYLLKQGLPVVAAFNTNKKEARDYLKAFDLDVKFVYLHTNEDDRRGREHDYLDFDYPDKTEVSVYLNTSELNLGQCMEAVIGLLPGKQLV